MKYKFFLWLALVLTGGSCACLGSIVAGESATDGEPRYLDKSLSEWIPLARLQGELLIPRDLRASAAVRDIGTNALPWLLRWIRSDQPETVQIGIEGLTLLGPAAEPAMPELIRLAGDWQSSSTWSNAIPALAAMRDSNAYPFGLPFLLSAATNTAAPVEYRLRVVQSLVGERLMTNTVAAVFVHCLRDTDWRVVTKGALGLDVYAIEPATAIPALAACQAAHTNRQAGSTARNVDDLEGDAAVRLSVINALTGYSSVYYYRSRNSPVVDPAYVAQIHEAMRPAVPVLVNALSDEDSRVARSAADALGNMALEPDLAEPALVKSMDYPQRDVQKAAIEALGNFGAAARSAVPALTQRVQADPGGYIGGPFAAVALRKIVPDTK